MNPLVAVIVIGLASFRIWRFLSVDEFPPVRVPREWLIEHSPEWVGNMISCSWCAGSWVVGVVTWVAASYASIGMPVLVGLGAATVAGFAAHYDEGRA